jgi:hypothetical protein
MKKLAQRQIGLPKLEADGATHRRDCECARCDAGFGPSEGARRAASAAWEERERLRKAQEALERKRERRRIQALALRLELDEEARRTAAALKEQAAVRAQVTADERLALLLASRRAGKSVHEALEEVERRFGPKPAPSSSRT